MPASSGNRLRYYGGAEQLAGVIRPFANVPGFVKYSEDLKNSKLDRNELYKHTGLLYAFAQLQPNLSFRERDMRDALSIIAGEKKHKFKFREGQGSEWVEAIQKRLRTMLRHVAQAQSKKTPAKWVGELLARGVGVDGGDRMNADDPDDVADDGNEDEDAEEEHHDEDECVDADDGDADADDPTGDTSAPSPSEFYVWFDPELEAACRCKPGGDGTKEISSDIRVPEGAANMDPVFVRFPDGCEYELSEISVQRWQQRRQAPAAAAIWTGIREATGSPLVVKYRPDRTMLVSLTECGKQICQVKRDIFTDQTEAAKIMTALAIDYSTGAISKAGLFPMRDAKVNEARKEGRLDAKGALKRPAACSSVASPGTMLAPESVAPRSALGLPGCRNILVWGIAKSTPEHLFMASFSDENSAKANSAPILFRRPPLGQTTCVSPRPPPEKRAKRDPAEVSKRPACVAASGGPASPTSEADREQGEGDDGDDSDGPTQEQLAESSAESLGPGPDFTMYDIAVFGPRAMP